MAELTLFRFQIFMDCPQRHDDIDGLGDKFLGRLEGIPRERLPGGSTGLANALAQSTTHANAEFLRTNLLARIQILNVLPSSKSHDLPVRCTLERFSLSLIQSFGTILIIVTGVRDFGCYFRGG
jgi:hypothetical protein